MPPAYVNHAPQPTLPRRLLARSPDPPLRHKLGHRSLLLAPMRHMLIQRL